MRALERIIFAAIPQRNFDQPDNRPHQIGDNANHAGLPSARGVLVLSFARIQDRLALLLIHRAVGDAVQDTLGILIPLFLHGFRDEHCGRLIPHCRHNALRQTRIRIVKHGPIPLGTRYLPKHERTVEILRKNDGQLIARRI